MNKTMRELSIRAGFEEEYGEIGITVAVGDENGWRTLETELAAFAGLVCSANPLDSIEAWMTGVGHGPEHVPLYEALCCEEQAETLDELDHESGAPVITARDALETIADMVRKYPGELSVRSRESLLDAHLDSAWVHLCAAMAHVGSADKLREAWTRLHKANVTDKQVDGRYVLDESGKVKKPAGWAAPTYGDLLENQ